MSFEIVEKTYLSEISSHAYLYRHDTGAELVYIQNKNDDNKVFSVTFKTPSHNDTGIPHILEHCLLCGSQKYPVKDPFNELSKGSLYTYLNAMTYQDKTVYPIASCNEKDFMNLMDVYLDAVFFPLIGERPEVFMQEGWHYVVENEEIAGYNGIVYSEMQGVYSDPLELLNYYSYKKLFEGSLYSYDSGGKPENITDLTYENFMKFYNTYYKPSNAHIYLYGDLDIQNVMKHIDENYLSMVKASNTEQYDEPKMPTPLKEPVFLTENYIISDDEDTSGKNHLNICYAINDTDNKRIMALSVLNLYFFGMESSFVKRTLIDEQMGQEVSGFLDSTIKTPVFSIVCQNSQKTVKQLDEMFTKTLKEIVYKGLDKALIEACLNKFEFSVREENFGNTPKGLIYNLNILTDWIYEGDIFGRLSKIRYIQELRNDLGYFVETIKEVFLNNNWKSCVEVIPKKSSENLKAIDKDKFKDIDIKKVVCDLERFEKYHNYEDTEEDINKIPLLTLEDVNTDVEKVPVVNTKIEGIEVLLSPLDTNDIIYGEFLSNSRNVPKESLNYIGLMCYLLGKLPTENYNLNDITEQINSNLGGLDFYFRTLTPESGDYMPVVVLKIKALQAKKRELFNIGFEVVKKTRFDDYEAIGKLIKELFSKLSNSLINNGHNYAIGKVHSYIFEEGKYEQEVSGLSFYNFIKNLVKEYDDKKDIIIKELENVQSLLFNKENTILTFTCSETAFANMRDELHSFISLLPDIKINMQNYNFEKEHTEEGVIIPSRVQYCVKGLNYLESDIKYTGKLAVLSNILNGEYLMKEVRIKGGAYGCYNGFNRKGFFYFYSYRDPNLRNTLDVYNNFTTFIENLELSEREMLKNILGAVNKYIRPKHVSAKGQYAIFSYLNNIKYEDLVMERKEIIETTFEDILRLGKIMGIFNKNYVCVVGNEKSLLENSSLFTNIVK